MVRSASRLVASAILAGVLGSCGADVTAPRSPVAPPPPPPDPPPVAPSPPPPPPVARSLELGEVVKGALVEGPKCVYLDVFYVACERWVLTSPAAGTLRVQLEWNQSQHGAVMVLRVRDREFTADTQGSITGRVAVAAGENVEITVMLNDFDWIANDPYTLLAVLE